MDARGGTAEQSAEELARNDLDGVVLGDIARESWNRHLVWRPQLLVEALEAFESGGVIALTEWMRQRSITYSARRGTRAPHTS